MDISEKENGNTNFHCEEITWDSVWSYHSVRPYEQLTYLDKNKGFTEKKSSNTEQRTTTSQKRLWIFIELLAAST